MRRKPAVSEILLTQILPELKSKTPYFSIKAVKRALAEANLALADETLREYMSKAMASGIVQDAGRGWYSRHEKPVSLDPKPLAKIIRAVEKSYPLLDFCCWSTVQFNPFAQHLIAQPTILLYAESDTLESVAERLREGGWNAWTNPNQKEAEKLVRPGEMIIYPGYLSRDIGIFILYPFIPLSLYPGRFPYLSLNLSAYHKTYGQ